MKLRCAAILLLLCVTTPAWAHQVDEFLQATTINVEQHRITLDMRLTPGAEVFRAVFVEMNSSGASSLSDADQRAYVELVRKRLSLAIDGHPLTLATTTYAFPKVEEMKNGVGDILLTFESEIPDGETSRRLAFTNVHQRGISAYLVNCLEPTDTSLRIVKQDRNYNQSEYVLDYTQSKSSAISMHADARTGRHRFPGALMVIVAGVSLAATALWILAQRVPLKRRS